MSPNYKRKGKLLNEFAIYGKWKNSNSRKTL